MKQREISEPIVIFTGFICGRSTHDRDYLFELRHLQKSFFTPRAEDRDQTSPARPSPYLHGGITAVGIRVGAPADPPTAHSHPPIDPEGPPKRRQNKRRPASFNSSRDQWRAIKDPDKTRAGQSLRTLQRAPKVTSLRLRYQPAGAR